MLFQLNASRLPRKREITGLGLTLQAQWSSIIAKVTTKSAPPPKPANNAVQRPHCPRNQCIWRRGFLTVAAMVMCLGWTIDATLRHGECGDSSRSGRVVRGTDE